MAENFPKLMADGKPQTQAVQGRTSVFPKNLDLGLPFKFQEIKDKENLEVRAEKSILCTQEEG